MIQKPEGSMETTLQSISTIYSVIFNLLINQRLTIQLLMIEMCQHFMLRLRTKFLCANCTKAFAIFSKNE